jgi:hypothetical protein
VMRAGGNVVKIERASAASTTPKQESEEIDIPDSWFSEIINNCGSLEDLSKQAKFL